MSVSLTVLRNLRLAAENPRATPVARVAYVWFKKAANAELDMLSRVQVLSGALGKNLLRGPNPGRSKLVTALKEAEELYAGMKGAKPQPAWFTIGDIGMYGQLINTMRGILAPTGIDSSRAEEVMQNALAGISLESILDPDAPLVTIKKPLVEAGRQNASGIQSGKESPGQIAAGPVATYLKRKVLNELSRYRRRQDLQSGPSVRDDESTGQIPDEREIAGSAFYMMMFGRSPLTREIHEKMRSSWKRTTQEETMDTWLRLLQTRGQLPSPGDMVKAMGWPPNNKSIQKFRDNWDPAMIRFFKDLRSDAGLMRDIDAWLTSQGVDTEFLSADDIFGDPNKTYGFFRRWKKKSSLDRVVEAWLGRQAT